MLYEVITATGIGYPPAEIEQAIIAGGSIRHDLQKITPHFTPDEVREARQAAQETVHLSPKIVTYIHQIVVATRQHPMIETGISPRGAISLALTSRVRITSYNVCYTKLLRPYG